MALVILATPAAYSSVQDDLVYTVYESVKTADPTTYPNYKYIADIYIGGDMVARVKKYPDPITGIGYFNIGQVVRNYMATTFNPTASQVVAQQMGAAEFNLSVQVKFGEEYTFTSYYNITLDSARVFFNNYNGRLAGPTSSLTAKANKVASTRPVNLEAFTTSPYIFIPYFPTSTSAVNFIVTPTGGGSAYSTTFTPGAANSLQVLNISPVAINAASAGTITANTTRYTVQIGSETYTVKLICESIFETFVLHFLNKFGGFESKIFSKVSRRSVAVEKKDYGKVPFTIGNDGSVNLRNSNGVYNESRSVYSSQFKEQLTLNSDLLTDSEYAWLQELIISPMVYIEENGYFLPVIVIERSYDLKKFVNENELFNMVISIEYGTQMNGQYR